MNLFTMAMGQPFLDRLAADWLHRAGREPLEHGLILLPTRRAARGLADAFLRQSDGRPMLLPRIAALGAVDEAPLALNDALAVPPAVEPMRRLAVLSRLILALGGRNGAPDTADRAWPLAEALAQLLDEAARAEIDLLDRLPDAAEAGFADHWRQTVQFLEIITRHWPDWLRDNGLTDIAARGIALLDRQAAMWRDTPPDFPVLVAGTTGGIPAVARLLRVVAGLPRGRVVLPGLDLSLSDSAWDSLDDSHPQAGLRRLLALIGARRADVTPLDAALDAAPDSPRVATLRRALLPAAALADWRETAPPRPEGLQRLHPADQQDEALAVALALRDAIQQPGTRSALITPDRALAVRVAAELLRFGVVVDDSAGEPLLDTPPAVFLRLIARAVADRLAPVPLLALLKHPFCAAGLSPAACRAAARRLERRALRGPRPASGLAGLALPADDADPRDTALLDGLRRALTPLLARHADKLAPPAALVATLIEAAEALAATNTQPGAAIVWQAEDGAALSTHLAAVLAALDGVPPQPPATLSGLLDAVLQGPVVRSRRALRGRDEAAGEHPRVFIWGLLEARLQTVDLAVLGGVAEGVWPPVTDPGPWMSRPMRQAVGLPAPEEQVGQMAHDFVSVCCAAGRAVISCPRRRDGAPAVPARWLTRLDAFLGGYGMVLPHHPATGWAARIDRPPGPPRPVAPPAPRPPVDKRPRLLRVTEIETWLRDPYAIYARHVLRLRALDPIDQPADAADYGSVVHAGIAAFLRACGADWPPDAAPRLRAAMQAALVAAGLRPALIAWWQPRLDRIADWVAAEETRRRAETPPILVAPEVMGEWTVSCPGGPFIIRGVADRIERYADGRLAILDYKTGAVPPAKDVEAGLAPQLPLEAIMAEAGAFGDALAAPSRVLIYWHLSGGFTPGEVSTLFQGDAARLAEATTTARNRLCALMQEFDQPGRAYLSRPHPKAAPRFSDYTHLARVAEWAMADEGG